MDERPARAARRLLLVVALALALRAWAALLLPVDRDEAAYLVAAQHYARALGAGDLRGVIGYPGDAGHPPLVKLLYAGGALAMGGADADSVRRSGRTISVAAGALAVAAMGFYFGPLAGGLLALHTLAVKYTSQAHLEAAPLLCAVVAVGAASAALQAPPGGPGQRRQLRLSAVALGLAAAGKLAYVLVAPAILALLLGGERVGPRARAGYGLVAALTFWAANPALWGDPAGRLIGLAGAWGAGGGPAAAAWLQPLLWLSSSAGADGQPAAFPYPGLDGLIFLLALAGLPGAWRAPERRWAALWLGGGLPLLLWPAAGPEHLLPLAPALCALAAPALAGAAARLRELDDYWGWTAQMLPRPPRYAWVTLALAAAFVAAVYGHALAAAALGRRGWSQLPPGAGRLPLGPVSDALALPDGRVALATARGALIWEGPGTALAPAASTEEPALALALDTGGTLWVGGPGGLTGIGPAGPHRYGADDFGLGSALVRALAAGDDGRLWVGGGAGAAVRAADGSWTALPQAAHGGLVLAVAVQPLPQGDAIWFGGRGVVSRLDTASGGWRHFGGAEGFGAAGVSDILVDAAGRVWAASLGAGLASWDGAGWSWRGAGEGLPSGTLTALAEGPPGTLWVGSAAPSGAGGAITRLTGGAAHTYLPHNSGFSAAEPLGLSVGPGGRLWIATRADGVVLYQPPAEALIPRGLGEGGPPGLEDTALPLTTLWQERADPPPARRQPPSAPIADAARRS